MPVLTSIRRTVRRLFQHERRAAEDNTLYRQSVRRASWMALGALVIIALGWLALFVRLENEQQRVEENALEDAAILARAYAKNLFRALEAVDQLTLLVRHGWQTSNGSFALDEVAQFGLFPAHSGFNVSVIDENGNLLTSTIPSARNVNVVNEPYFAIHRIDPAAGFHIGTARIGNFSQTPVVPFSRRLSDAAGNFKGIVLTSVVPEYFTSSYDEIALREQGFAAILSMDKVVRLARIGQDIFLPHSGASAMKASPSFEERNSRALLEGEKWFVDEQTRFVAWQKTDGYDMLTLVGLERDAILAPYETYRGDAIRNAALATALAIFLCAIAIAVYLRLASRKQQFETMQKTYRAATESGSDGIFIARPIYDARGKAVDFEICDCNDRGARLLGHSRKDLIGGTVRSFYRGAVAERSIRMLRKALGTRYFEGEADWTRLGLSGPSWVQFRISRPADDLAVTMRDISEQKAHLAALEKRGNEDALTGLPNRHWANQYLPAAVAKSAADNSTLALLYIDLDGFKVVNDTMGHEAGDDVLRKVALRLRDAVRPQDHLVRLGGDEFLVVLDHIICAADAAVVAERVLAAFRSPIKTARGTHMIGTSIGISAFPADGCDAATLLNSADIAMYSAKSSGKRGYRFFDQRFYDQVRARHRKEAELREALTQNQFVMYYQPRLDVATGATCSMEALVRWAHPARGIIGPAEFIPLAEENGLIVELGEKVINMVCAQLAQWAEEGRTLVPVSINVSGRQFDESKIDELLSTNLARYKIEPRWVEVELTESTVSTNSEAVGQVLNTIQAMGIKLLVDDFGTGYSSLAQLQQLDFDVLKVDRSFTAQLQQSRSGPVFFNAIITMAHALGMRVVAEGVETYEQLCALRDLGCDEVQGFFVSEPLPASQVVPAMSAATS